MADTYRIPFLNTYVDNLTAAEAKSCVDQLIKEPGYHYIVTPNTDIVVKMQDDAELKAIVDKKNTVEEMIEKLGHTLTDFKRKSLV